MSSHSLLLVTQELGAHGEFAQIVGVQLTKGTGILMLHY